MIRRSAPVLAALLLAGCSSEALTSRTAIDDRQATVARVVDGDTIELEGGDRVRLLQVDAPDVGECYHDQASAALRRRLPAGTAVTLQADPALDATDRYGRWLRYVVDDQGANMSAYIVGTGSGAPYFYRGERGKHAALLQKRAQAAKSRPVGLWKVCTKTRLDPIRGLESRR